MTFLRFPDQKTAEAALKAADLWIESEEYSGPKTASLDHALDVVGIISRDGVELPGYHINFVGPLPADWEAYLVEPANPVRVFA
jgi:hypothetical protein